MAKKFEDFNNNREDVLRSEFKQEVNFLRDEIKDKIPKWVFVTTCALIGSAALWFLTELINVKDKLSEQDCKIVCAQTEINNIKPKK